MRGSLFWPAASYSEVCNNQTYYRVIRLLSSGQELKVFPLDLIVSWNQCHVSS